MKRALVVSLLALALAHGPQPARAAERPVVAVFNIEVKRVALGKDRVAELSDYFADSLAATGAFQVVPRDQLKKRLVGLKKKSYQACYDQSCQVEIGRELAASKSLATRLMKIGSKCVVTATLYDLRRAATEGGATAEGGCGEDALRESLKKVVPHLSPDAAERLGGIVYKRLPTLARAIVSRAAVDQAAGSAVEFLLKQFYALAKDKLLRQLSDRARLSIALPDVPIRTLSLGPTTEAGGGLRLAITTSLPIGAALGPREVRSQRLPADRVTLRASAATLAELVNWAMARGLVPSRYNDKGQADDQGEYLAAVEWIAGERPMKAHLWQLEGSCMRLDMGANARVGAKDGKVSIAAEDGVIEDVDAAPLTEVGVFFYALWKDAVNVTLDRSAELRFKVADQELVSRVEQATLTDDELTLIVTLQPADRAARIH